MNFRAIRKTAVTRWSLEDEGYVTESPLFEQCTGVGDTPEEAEQVFEIHLDMIEKDYQKGDFVIRHGKRGRPKKGNVPLYADVPPDIKQVISEIADDLNISLGDAIVYYVTAARAQANLPKRQAG